MSFLELQKLIIARKTGLVKRHETLQRSMYLQTAMRQSFFNGVHRSMEERAGRLAPEQHQPFFVQQRGLFSPEVQAPVLPVAPVPAPAAPPAAPAAPAAPVLGEAERDAAQKAATEARVAALHAAKDARRPPERDAAQKAATEARVAALHAAKDAARRAAVEVDNEAQEEAEEDGTRARDAKKAWIAEQRKGGGER
jgi:type IV secretory pathway VirB10-like protein